MNFVDNTEFLSCTHSSYKCCRIYNFLKPTLSPQSKKWHNLGHIPNREGGAGPEKYREHGSTTPRTPFTRKVGLISVENNTNFITEA